MDIDRMSGMASAWAQPRMCCGPALRQRSEGRDFPGGSEVRTLPANAGDTGSNPGPGRSHMR